MKKILSLLAMAMVTMGAWAVEEQTLYEIYAYGQQDSVYTVSDTLYVLKATMAAEPEDGSSNYIYVTDNRRYVYLDYLIDFGESPWVRCNPSFYAIDCKGNQEIYHQIAAMDVIKPGTLTGKNVGCYTNQRLTIDSAPTNFAGVEPPVFTIPTVDMMDTLLIFGNQVVVFENAVYRQVDGKEYIYGYSWNYDPDTDNNLARWQPLEIDRRYVGNNFKLTHDSEAGVSDVRFVIKIKESWNMFEPISKMTFTMNPSNPLYYTNYVVCPIDENYDAGDEPAGNPDINDDGQWSMGDVTTLIAYVLGNNPTPCLVENCDVTDDGNISMADVTALIGQILGN